MDLAPLDITIFIGYCIGIVSIALLVSRSKKGEQKDSRDYFLAGNTLPWWAIGTSLIASNISAEQFIGMSGSGYAMGLGIASYEWMSAATLIIVGKFFLPIFLNKGIYTMPQFLEQRYDGRVRTMLSIFWLAIYVFVNLTSVLYMGGLTIQNIAGVELWQAICGLALFAAIYSIYGGLMAVAWTDVIQVVVLIVGGIITTIIALQVVGDGEGIIAGMKVMYEQAPDKFNMIFSSDNPNYKYLPGIAGVFGALWVANFFYWGLNQYIIQRALGAKNLQEAQRGLMFAGYLKLLMPLLVVVPGIAAFVLGADIDKSDEAYPWLLDNIVPVGITGLAFAALCAAIVSSVSSMMNSTSTIFTMDIYKNYINKHASERMLVTIGRVVSALALIIAVFVAPQLNTLDQAFQFIQNFTGYVSPAILVIFLFGFFWKKTTANAALWTAAATIPLVILFETLFEMPFMFRIGLMFLLLAAFIVIMTLAETKQNHPKAIKIDPVMFRTGFVFNTGSTGIVIILVILYYSFW